jgi:hypothetical protein
MPSPTSTSRSCGRSAATRANASIINRGFFCRSSRPTAIAISCVASSPHAASNTRARDARPSSPAGWKVVGSVQVGKNAKRCAMSPKRSR